jgi:hypothetical protein
MIIQAECLQLMAALDLMAGRLSQAAAHLREAFLLAMPTGLDAFLANCLDLCRQLCSRTQHPSRGHHDACGAGHPPGRRQRSWICPTT